MQGGSDAVGGLIHLLIGVFPINSHQGLMLRLRLSKVTDTLVEEPEWRFTRCRLTQVTQIFLLVFAHDGELTDLLIWLSHHALSHCHDTLSQRLCQPF